MAFEVLDRRLLARNEFRNTTNNFLGYRVHFGKQQNDWIWILRVASDGTLEIPVGQARRRYLVLWRRAEYPPLVGIHHDPAYFMGRKVNGDPTNSVVANRKADMDIYAPGLRVYGLFGSSGFDFDADINKQFGTFGELSRTKPKQTLQHHDALAYELNSLYLRPWSGSPEPVIYGYEPATKVAQITTTNASMLFTASTSPGRATIISPG